VSGGYVDAVGRLGNRGRIPERSRDETIDFATALLDLVHRASTTTSYKYALLMALIEIASESEIGEGVPTRPDSRARSTIA
jgi:hypothetical protein